MFLKYGEKIGKYINKHKCIKKTFFVTKRTIFCSRNSNLQNINPQEAISIQTMDLSIPVHNSHIKIHCCTSLMKNQQDHWDYSDKGRYTHGQVSRTTPAITFDNSISDRVWFLWWPSFLNCIKILLLFVNTVVGGWEVQYLHYYYHCPLTNRQHIQSPLDLRARWHMNILTHKYLLLLI